MKSTVVTVVAMLALSACASDRDDDPVAASTTDEGRPSGDQGNDPLTTTTVPPLSTTTTVLPVEDDRTDFTNVPGYWATFTDGVELLEALDAAGFFCGVRQGWPVDGATRYDCRVDAVVTLWRSEEQRRSTQARRTGEVGEGLLLNGANWTVSASEDEIRALAPRFGGTIMENRSY